jgi:hypothetical protein
VLQQDKFVVRLEATTSSQDEIFLFSSSFVFTPIAFCFYSVSPRNCSLAFFSSSNSKASVFEILQQFATRSCLHRIVLSPKAPKATRGLNIAERIFVAPSVLQDPQNLSLSLSLTSAFLSDRYQWRCNVAHCFAPGPRSRRSCTLPEFLSSDSFFIFELNFPRIPPMAQTAMRRGEEE